MSVKIVDDDIDEVHIMLNDKSIRSYYYDNEDQRRLKIRCAREFAEGWHQAMQMKG